MSVFPHGIIVKIVALKKTLAIVAGEQRRSCQALTTSNKIKCFFGTKR